MQRIKDFDSFSVNEDLNFNLSGILSKVLPVLGTGFTKTVKQKFAAILLEKLGIMENTMLSGLVQEFVDQIPVSDIPGIITGDNINAEYFAPKFAGFLQEFVQRKGLDTIATQIGIKPDGWIYSILRESLQTQIGKEKLTKFFLSAFGGDNIGQSALSQLDPSDKNRFSDALSQRIGQNYNPNASSNTSSSTSKEDGGFWSSIQNILGSGVKPAVNN